MSKIFVLSGSSGCGKTTLMNNILKEGFSLSVVQKYGTRRRRSPQNNIEDDVCQVFRSPLPTILLAEELIAESKDFIDSIWEKTEDHQYKVLRKPSIDNQIKFEDLIGDSNFFTKNISISENSLLKAILEILELYYKSESNILSIRPNLKESSKRKLSHILEDLMIRVPIIVLGENEYWDDLGEKVQLRGVVDIAYALNKGQYGLSTETIQYELDQGRDVITILSDFRIINRLKGMFNESLVVIYIASSVDPSKLEMIQIGRHGIDSTLESSFRQKLSRLQASVNISKWGNVARWIHELNADWMNVKPDAANTEFRTERIKMFHLRYIDNITLFDHVILNYNEGHPEDMTLQLCSLIKFKRTKIRPKKPPLFVVSAASNAGKGTMMEMLNLIGSDRVQILSKIAKRDKKKNDKNDGMVPIGTKTKPLKSWGEWPSWWDSEMIATAKLGEFPSDYDFTWSFHGKSVHYAVSDKEIQRNFKDNSAQIVVSNTDQIDEFIKRYGDRVIFLLLYRLSSIEDTQLYYEIEEGLPEEEAKSRAKEVANVLKEYIKNVAKFDHVILNTARPEDLYDQIFQLVEFYHKAHD